MIQMRIRKYLTQTLLASAVFTSQGLVPAADSPVLSPVTKIQLKSAGDVALRKVPDATETRGAVQQIQYQEDASSPQNSTVNAELQQVFRKNGQPCHPCRLSICPTFLHGRYTWLSTQKTTPVRQPPNAKRKNQV